MNKTNKLKTKAGILVSNTIPLCYLALSAILAEVAAAFPDANQSLVQMLITIPSFMSLFSALVAGKIANQFSKKKILLFGMGCYVLGGLMPFFLHGSIYFLVAGSVVIGIGSGFMTAISGALVCDYFDGEEKGQVLGLAASSVGVGGMFFTLLGGQAARFGWHYAYLAFAFVIPVMLVTIFALPETGIKGNGNTAEQKAHGTFYMDAKVFLLMAIGFIYFILQNTYNTNSAMYMNELQIGTTALASFVTMCNAFGGIMGGLGFQFVLKKLKKQIQTGAMAIAAIGFFLAVVFPQIPGIFLGGFLVGAAFAMFNASGTYLISENVPEHNQAMMIAVYSSVINVGAFLSPVVINLISGAVNDSIGIRYVVAAAGILLLVAVGFVGSREK